MRVSIGGIPYTFHSEVLSERSLREAYFVFANRIFGLHFDPWYASGFWDGAFIPYVLYDGDTAVSSVGVCLNEVHWQGTVKRYAQVSTVMTLPAYRGKGLNRWIMETVLEEWRKKGDAIYLLSNDSAAAYYEKCGFEEYTECDFTRPVQGKPTPYRKLSLQSPSDFELLIEKYKLSNPFSALTVRNICQFVFHCLQFHREHLYYLEAFGAAVVAEHRGDTLLCHDIYTHGGCTLDDVLAALARDDTRTAQLGFTPLSMEGCTRVPSTEADNHLFVLPGMDNIFKHHRVLFPLLSRA